MVSGGVGVTVELDNGRFRVKQLLPDTPAADSPLKVGDELQRIDGRDLMGMTVGQVAALITGPAGSNVSFTVRSSETRNKQIVKLQRKLGPITP